MGLSTKRGGSLAGDYNRIVNYKEDMYGKERIYQVTDSVVRLSGMCDRLCLFIGRSRDTGMPEKSRRNDNISPGRKIKGDK